MCLCTKRKLKTKEKSKIKLIKKLVEINKKIAKSDIKCYKVLENYGGVLYSPFRSYKYELNTHYYNTGPRKFSYRLGFESCYLSYSVWSLEVNQGLHSYTSFKNINLFYTNKNIVVECIIPKGSEYFEGSKNDYVSDNLILTEKVFDINKKRIKFVN